MKPISTQLRRWRKYHELSQSEAATKLGVPVRTLQEWEQGRRAPRGLALRAIERITNAAR